MKKKTRKELTQLLCCVLIGLGAFHAIMWPRVAGPFEMLGVFAAAMSAAGLMRIFRGGSYD